MQHPAANYEEERKVDLKRYGPWAVIIGGSEGVGASFARKLAADGFGLLLVARKIEPLTQLAEALRADGADIRILQMDVTRADFLDRVAEASADIDVGLLIYNAGSVAPASFLDTPLDSALNAVNLNVVGPLKLAHHFGRTMSARGGGGIIILGSVAGAAGGAGLWPVEAGRGPRRGARGGRLADGGDGGDLGFVAALPHAGVPPVMNLQAIGGWKAEQ